MPTLQVVEYLDLLEQADRQRAIDAVLSAYDGGVSFDRLVSDVIGPAQIEVGHRWARGEWSVAQEHAATAISDAAIGALATRTAAQPTEGPIVLCCAEGDWHSMGGRMATELLRASDWDVVFLGASLPANQLPDFLRENQPFAVGLSCTVAMFFAGARRCIAAAHSVGVPVIAGGAAFGDSDRNALRLGADAWAHDVSQASEVLRVWHEEGWPVVGSSVEVLDDGAALDAIWMEVQELAHARMLDEVEATRGADDRELARIREDLGYLIRFLSGALVVGDDDVFRSFLAWLASCLEVGDHPSGILAACIRSVEAAVPADLAEAHRLLAEARTSDGGPGPVAP